MRISDWSSDVCSSDLKRTRVASPVGVANDWVCEPLLRNRRASSLVCAGILPGVRLKTGALLTGLRNARTAGFGQRLRGLLRAGSGANRPNSYYNIYLLYYLMDEWKPYGKILTSRDRKSAV